tara:strand:+ start:3665 stop:3925 length:261 start_codon:yes stop_codon:yes gene_type:complete
MSGDLDDQVEQDCPIDLPDDSPNAESKEMYYLLRRQHSRRRGDFTTCVGGPYNMNLLRADLLEKQQDPGRIYIPVRALKVKVDIIE